jgi:hypothetical protein
MQSRLFKISVNINTSGCRTGIEKWIKNKLTGTYPGRGLGGAAHLLPAPHLQSIVLLTPVVGVEKLKWKDKNVD